MTLSEAAFQDGVWEPEWTKRKLGTAEDRRDEGDLRHQDLVGKHHQYGTHFASMALLLRKAPGLGGKGAIGGAALGAATDIASTTRNDETATTDIVDSQILTRIPHIGGQTQGRSTTPSVRLSTPRTLTTPTGEHSRMSSKVLV